MKDRVSAFPFSRIVAEGNPVRDRLAGIFASQTSEGTEKERKFFSVDDRYSLLFASGSDTLSMGACARRFPIWEAGQS